MNAVRKYSFLLFTVPLLCLLLPAYLPGQEHPAPPNDEQTQKRFEWSSYMQLRYTGVEDGQDLYALRRFKVMFSGHLKPEVEYFVQGIFKDGNRSDTDGRPYLQEAWVRYTAWKYGHLTIGQFKPPFGMERMTRDWELVSIDRAQATDHLIPDGQLGDSFGRDRGLQLDAWLAANRFYYAAAVFDGNGANMSFKGNGPLVVGRIVGVLYRAPTQSSRHDRISLGGAVSTRKDHRQDFTATLPGTAALGYAQFSGRDTRLNLEASADFSPLSLSGEYFYAFFDPNRAPLVEVRASGFYVQGAYRFWRKLQAVAKREGFNPNRAVRSRNDLRWNTMGLNWFIRGNRVRISADYVFKHEARDSFPNNALLLQFQLFAH
ncbi:MAG: OprO/OprP family phosphate-selective porin [Acidobacteria bacterium]|nr:OprO/OprP family phosphate-selective porin [Acidobacteriota bacterium]